jgi:hypothetical protein
MDGSRVVDYREQVCMLRRKVKRRVDADRC